MDLKQSPFSLYDFVGYFIPGSVFIFVLEYGFSYLGMDTGLRELTRLTEASQLLPFVLSAYVCGHLLSLASSFTVERLYIWVFDYPSKSLLRYKERSCFEEKFSPRNVVKMLNSVVLAPVSVVVLLLSFFTVGRPGMVHALDPLLTRIIRRKTALLLFDRGQIGNPNFYAAPSKSDYFRLIYHYIIENSEVHARKMQNYVALFGFNRAMCFLFCLVFWVGVASLPFSGVLGFRVMMFSLIFSVLFFFGFVKFYRRFSLEGLMALAACYQAPDDIKNVVLDPVPMHQKKSVGVKSRERSPFHGLMAGLRTRAKHKKSMQNSISRT